LKRKIHKVSDTKQKQHKNKRTMRDWINLLAMSSLGPAPKISMPQKKQHIFLVKENIECILE